MFPISTWILVQISSYLEYSYNINIVYVSLIFNFWKSQAFLAYGLQKNHMKSTHMILKVWTSEINYPKGFVSFKKFSYIFIWLNVQAAYNVGGHSVNACTIQGSILGCEPHRPALVYVLAILNLSLPFKPILQKNQKIIEASVFEPIILSLTTINETLNRVMNETLLTNYECSGC